MVVIHERGGDCQQIFTRLSPVSRLRDKIDKFIMVYSVQLLGRFVDNYGLSVMDCRYTDKNYTGETGANLG
jgi:hypothetical protein